ncbi:nicotinate-nucleotide adenylyltransferase [Synechococcus sp. A15-24]|uniref:nicotinate-nucleotide adenylyltransferase n=1 Tax=Synechococcus sp. A15-24 TaxID=1050635 RepID=UPI0016483C00|nr:nicotinate-nucleotide adenylyltransferase [Synechococcus sp. A15-24]QNJ28238.1 nicotinate (nicotinamide) nucleotide adenylyltransferase [Synechococcus sp. A15-24]
MQQIALLGTSADPPTCGHQALLKGLLSLYPQVATWASDNPQKRHGAPLALRAQLLQALVEEINDPRLQQDQTLSHPFTIRTIEQATTRWPEEELVFVVGSDLAALIPGWKSSAHWLNRCRLAIAPRQGWPLRDQALEDLKRLGARIDLLELQVPASASSALRQSPEQRQIPAAVWTLLLEHNLYGLSPSLR